MTTNPDTGQEIEDQHDEIEGPPPRPVTVQGEHGRRPPPRRGEPLVIDASGPNDDPRPDTGVEVVGRGRGPRRAARQVGGLVRAGAHVITTAAGGPVRRAGTATVAGVKAAPKVTARAVVTTAAGYGSLSRRALAAVTHGQAREQIRAARAAGDSVAAAEWIERLDQLKTHRAQRVRELPRQALAVLAVSGLVLAVLAGLLLAGGVVSWLAPGGFTWTSWWDLIGDTIRFLTAAVTIAATAAAWLAVPGLLAAGWWEGHRHTAGPGWLATSADGEVDALVDETTIARALDALRISQISAYLKAGTPLQFLTPARVDGRGTHAVVRLPAGVTADRIARRRADLATGLHRLAKEVWPTTGTEAGILDLWVADKGALAEGAGPHPLLDSPGVVDVFKGVPFGKSLRGTPVIAPLLERNTLTGGMPGQGKSSAARVLMVGAALDPIAELRIWVPDANFDFEVFRPRCSRYVMGAEDDRIAEILDHLRELHAEVQARGALLVRYEIPAVTRDYATKGVGLHPLFCLLEEAHVAIQHPQHGAEVSKLLVDIVRLGRKRGIHMIVSTQAPTKDSMPRDVTRNCSNGVAFAVGDHVANDALLGQGAYAAGHRATELIPGTDRGTAVVKGFSGQRSEIVQVYFLSVDKDTPTGDQVTPLIERAMDAIERRGKGLPGADRPAPTVETETGRDLLADLDAVLGDEPVRAADVPALLARHAPRHRPYQAMTGKGLRDQLAREHGIKVPSTGNRWPLDPITVRDALARQATADLDDHEQDRPDRE